jgi:ABC-type transport system involved in cytochrome c biogenesis permease subunit
MISHIAFILLLIALSSEIVFLLNKKTDLISGYILLLISVLLFAEIIYRSIQIKFIALTNTFESLVFYSGITALILFIYQFYYKRKAIQFILFAGTMIAFVLLAIASSPLVPKEIKPPIPALQSSWLILHVAFSFIGESFFAFSFTASIYYFFTKNKGIKEKLDSLIYTAIGIGYPIFTAGAIIFGAIWAQYAWGRFWGWDPKETFALITWLVYTLYLHLRLVSKVKISTTILIAICGFLLTLFTFFGVNYLLSGLHSYG